MRTTYLSLCQRILGNFKTKTKLMHFLIITNIFMENVIKTDSLLHPLPDACCQEIIYISLIYLIASFYSKRQTLFSFFRFSNSNICTSPLTLTVYYLCVVQLKLQSFQIFYYLNFSGHCTSSYLSFLFMNKH